MVVCVVLFGTVAFASSVFNKSISATGTLIANAPDMTFYSDSACTNEITSIDFGSVNESGTYQFYIKNTGNKTLSNFTASSDLSPEIGSINGTLPVALTKGISAPLTLNLVSASLLVDTNFSCEITIDCSY